MVLNMLVTVAQWERETISERVKVAMAHKKAQGAKFGGKRVEKPSNTWEPAPEERERILDVIRANQGMSLRGLARVLNDQGFARSVVRERKENGLRIVERQGKWHAASVSKFLRQNAAVY